MKVFSPILVYSLYNSTKPAIHEFEHVAVLETIQTSSSIKISHLTSPRKLEDSQMKETNAIAYIWAVLHVIIEDMVALTCTFAYCNVWVSHLNFLHAGIEGEAMSTLDITSSTVTYPGWL